MPKQLLHVLRRQFAPAIGISIDAPGRIEVPHPHAVYEIAQAKHDLSSHFGFGHLPLK
jgi:hypothetical protein